MIDKKLLSMVTEMKTIDEKWLDIAYKAATLLPEPVILESVLEGMAEYYSKNLSREVMKGMRETASSASTPEAFLHLDMDIIQSQVKSLAGIKPYM